MGAARGQRVSAMHSEWLGTMWLWCTKHAEKWHGHGRSRYRSVSVKGAAIDAILLAYKAGR
jgi:hypothetical protein